MAVALVIAKPLSCVMEALHMLAAFVARSHCRGSPFTEGLRGVRASGFSTISLDGGRASKPYLPASVHSRYPVSEGKLLGRCRLNGCESRLAASYRTAARQRIKLPPGSQR